MSARGKVIISHIYPPIPTRDHDWCAYHDGEEEEQAGWGATAEEALADLDRLDQERAEALEDADKIDSDYNEQAGGILMPRIIRGRLLFIGQWISALGHRPVDVVRATGINEGYLSELIAGSKKNPSAVVLVEIATFLNIPIQHLFRPPPPRLRQWRKQAEAVGRQRGHLFVAEWMADRELSAEKLAKRLGVDRVTVSRWRNQQHRLNPDKIAAIAEALDVDCAQLFRPPPQKATLSQAIGWLAAGLRWQADRGER